MPRYFFNLRYGDAVIPDPVGIELDNLDGVLEQINEVIRDFYPVEFVGWELVIVDEAGATQLTISAAYNSS